MTETPARRDAALVTSAVAPSATPAPRTGTSPAGGATGAAGTAPIEAYRGLMSSFPTGVAIVTTVDAAGHPFGLTCTSLASVTLRPPTLLVCIDVRSGTLRAARAHGRFAVNLLHARGRRAAEVFSRPSPDRFSQIPWQPSPGGRLPWLVDDAFAVAECVLVQTTVVGDHAVVIGEVRRVDQTADVPLMYGERRFARWTADSP